MEAELIQDHTLSGGKLVAAVTKIYPGMSIDDILEKTRYITLRRIFNTIKSKEFPTALHIVEELCTKSLTLEDVIIVAEWVIHEQNVHPEFISVLESSNISAIYKFIESVKLRDRRSCSTRRRWWMPSCVAGNSE